MPLQIIRQDITKMRVDAIVNTTNEEMVGYSGVDLAIHTAAGAALDLECARLAPLGLGEAKITDGYALPCRYIIHTSGPVWRGGGEGESVILKSCYTESLKLAAANGCESVAFPLISSGAYGFPKDQVLKFAIGVITEFLNDHELTVYLCVFDRTSYEFSRELFSEIREYIDDDYAEMCEDCAPAPMMASEQMRRSESMPRQRSMATAKMPAPFGNSEAKSLEEYMRSLDKPFAYKLFDLIDERGMTDVECYKRANVDKRTFSKIRSNKDYKPSKQTAIAFAISLQLSLDETQALLATAGYTLSRSNVFDKIIRYFIQSGNYDIFEINEALFEFDQQLLGAV